MPIFVGFCAFASLPGLPLAMAIFYWGFFGLGAVILVAGPWIRPVAMTMDSAGVTIPLGLRLKPKVFLWADVQAVVTWESVKHGKYIGVLTTPEYRHRTGLDTKRGGRWMNKQLGMPVARTCTFWNGPPREHKAVIAASWRLAPQIPWVDLAYGNPFAQGHDPAPDGDTK
ncbi:hypothetical protein [Streptomyces sp. SID3343]|uniref:hypothetical protein n=1 Tax=Streptomyces sp. SID3343 TaxID=2690260 RepID=UPI00136C8E52|nr:hypothetical protein [Streptomyces sp. SID3343]